MSCVCPNDTLFCKTELFAIYKSDKQDVFPWNVLYPETNKFEEIFRNVRIKIIV